MSKQYSKLKNFINALNKNAVQVISLKFFNFLIHDPRCRHICLYHKEKNYKIRMQIMY